MADVNDGPDDADLTMLLCDLLGQLDGWDWSTDTEQEYPASSVGVFYGRIGDSPDQAVGVRIYGGEDDDQEDLNTRRAQLRVRGGRNRPDGADRIAAQAKRALHGLSRVGGISGISRTSFVPLGADSNGREERTENYLIILDNPEASE